MVLSHRVPHIPEQHSLPAGTLSERDSAPENVLQKSLVDTSDLVVNQGTDSGDT